MRSGAVGFEFRRVNAIVEETADVESHTENNEAADAYQRVSASQIEHHDFYRRCREYQQCGTGEDLVD